MANEATELLTRHLRHLSTAARLEGMPDRDLVERFLAGRDEDAFGALLRRHGPMVLGVCRRILHDVHAAEDAFQATFLVFSRKASCLRRADSVGCFLHGIAHRLALKARSHRARQKQRDMRPAIEKSTADPLAELTVREAQAMLDEELARLPEKYRLPLVLCCLEGRTREEAARQLGWAAKLVKSRLEQGREQLRYRLSRRGLTLPAALMALLLAEEASPAVLPAVLMRTTMEAVGSSSIAPSVALLAESVLSGGGSAKIKVIGGLLLLSGMLAAGMGAFAPPPDKEALGAPAHAATESAKSEEQHPPRADHYGDPLPPHALARLGTVRFRPGDPIAHIAFSPDGKLLATATQNMEGNANSVSISLWDRTTGKRLHEFYPEKWPPLGLAFAPGGKILATQDRQGKISLWDVGTRRLLRRFEKGNIGFSGSPKGGEPVGAGFAFAPNGNSLAARGEGKAIHLWETATGRELRTFKAVPEDFAPLAFSRDGKTLATSGKDLIRLWDVDTGKEKRRLTGHEGSAGTPAFSTDGKTFTALARTPKQFWQVTAYCWDIDTAKLMHKWALPANPVFAASISPDGKTVLAGGDISRMRLYDLATGKEVRRLTAPFTGAAFSAVFSPDGKTIAAGGENRVLQLWDAASGQPLAPFAGHQGVIRSLALTPNGKYLASIASDERIILWDLSTGQPLAGFASPRGNFSSVAMSPDGQTLAAVGEGPFVRLLAIPSGKELRRFPCGDRQRSVAFSADGRFLATGRGYKDNDRSGTSICLWEVATGKQVHEFKPLHAKEDRGSSEALAFSPDGRLLASSDGDSTVDLWDLVTVKRLYRLLCHHSYNVSSLAFSPDGRTLATASSRDKTIRLWEVWSGRTRGSITGHTDWVGSLSFSPDGLLASASHDKIIRLWDLTTGTEWGCFRGHDSVVGPLAFSSDGQRLVSGGWDTTILVWDMKALRPARPARASELATKEIEEHWADLADADAARAFQAIRTLIRARHQSVSFLKDRLRPIPPIAAEKLAVWIADLDSDRFEIRAKAEMGLAKMAELAEPALRRASQNGPSSLELRRRLEALLQRLEGPVTSAETLRQLRAVEVLEHIDSPKARDVLRTLTDGAPEARLTREARAALERTGRRSNRAP